MGKRYFVYLLASKRNGTLYVGMTNDLCRRVEEHKSGAVPGFTRKYNVSQLVWFEMFEDLEAAQRRENAMKHWLRKWKIELIEKGNPNWRDLSDAIDHIW